MRRPSLWLSGALVLIAPAVAQRPVAQKQAPGVTFYAIEDLADRDGVTRRRQLVRFDIGDGQVGPKQVVLEREQGFYGHFGRYRLVSGRYLVTPGRRVVDVHEGEVLAGEPLERVLEAVPTLERGRVPAPDSSGVAWVNPMGELWFRPNAGKSRRLGKEFGYSLSLLSSGMASGAPVLWLNAKTLVTQRVNGELLAVTLDGKVEPFVSVAGVRPPVSRPSLEWDPHGRLIYSCGPTFVIDAAKRTAQRSRWRAIGHDFEIERDLPLGRGRIVRHRGKEIGRFICKGYASKSAPGRIAIPCAPRGKLGSPRIVRLWDAKSRQWSSARFLVNSLVGWLSP